jgi:hypothetical protein
MTGWGTNWTNLPNLSTPDKTCKPPVTQVTRTKAETPWVEATVERRTVVASEGPVTPKGAPPSKQAMVPPTMALVRPTSGLTPEARAMASERGIATHPTVTPAIRSLKRFSRENINFHSGRRVESPVFFFTLSHNETEEGEEEEEEEEEEEGMDRGSINDTSQLSSEASEDLEDSKRLITVMGLRIRDA